MLWDQRVIYWSFVVLAVIFIYWLLLRPWLKRLPALQGVYNLLESQEVGLFSKFRVSVSGLKRELFSNFVIVAGVLVSIHDLFIVPFMAAVDVTPFLPPWLTPYWPMITVAIGLIMKWLNTISVTPMGEVNPGVVADVTALPLSVVAEATAPDPAVAFPTQRQLQEEAQLPK